MPAGEARRAEQPTSSGPTSASCPWSEDREPGIRHEVVAADQRRFDAVVEVPPLKWRRELVGTIRNESPAELIAGLGRTDDMHFAATSVTDLYGNMADARLQMLVLTRLTRVRWLLELGRSDPCSVIPPLREAFRKAMIRFPEAHSEMVKFMVAGGGAGFPDEAYEIPRMQNIAGTYLLAELGDHDSLPILADSFRMSLNEMYYWVPSGTTLYAMHRLVLTYPESRLSEEARRLRQEYLDSATKVLPPPREIQVTAWNANYEESDPRISIMDPKRRVLTGQPRMTIPVYPWTFTDGTRISEFGGHTSEKAKELFGRLESFVNAAYGSQ
jgi:hypothetical protein